MKYDVKTKCQNCRKFCIPFADVENKFLSGIIISDFDMPKNIKGVYMIVGNYNERPDFVYPSPAGWFRGKDPSISIEALNEKWVDGANIFYIGRTENCKHDLKYRIEQHINFWGGEPVAAWGGRIIAQIKGYEDLQVWYMECADPKQIKKELISLFKEHYGKLPFANWKK